LRDDRGHDVSSSLVEARQSWRQEKPRGEPSGVQGRTHQPLHPAGRGGEALQGTEGGISRDGRTILVVYNITESKHIYVRAGRVFEMIFVTSYYV
jgi:hypothetical protein